MWGKLYECKAMCNQISSCTHIAYFDDNQGCLAYSACSSPSTFAPANGAATSIIYQRTRVALNADPTVIATHHTDATWSIAKCHFTTCPMFKPSSTTTSITMSFHPLHAVTATTQAGVQYAQSDWNQNMCPTISHHSAITTSAECQAAATAMGVEWRHEVDDSVAPAGCMHYGLPTGNGDFSAKCGIYYNTHSEGAASHTARVVCTVATKFEVTSNNCGCYLCCLLSLYCSCIMSV